MLHAKFVEIGPPVPEKILKDFLPYMGMAAILVMWPKLFMYTLVSPSYRCFISTLALIGQSVTEKKIFDYYGNIHVYFPGVGEDQPLGSNVFHNHKSSVNSPIPFKFFSANDILIIDKFPHSNAWATYVDIAVK